jgi:hypothetical protein
VLDHLEPVGKLITQTNALMITDSEQAALDKGALLAQKRPQAAAAGAAAASVSSSAGFVGEVAKMDESEDGKLTSESASKGDVKEAAVDSKAERKLFARENKFSPSGSAFYSAIPSAKVLRQTRVASSKSEGKTLPSSAVTELFMDKSDLLAALVKQEWSSGAQLLWVWVVFSTERSHRTLPPQITTASWVNCSLPSLRL